MMFELNGKKVDSDTYAVVGDPISHSLSPDIHKIFAEQTEQALRYERWHLTSENFDSNVLRFFESGGGGLNVTAPHKQAAFQLCAQRSSRAALAKATNTLSSSDGEILGDTTDGLGLVADIARLGWPITGKRVLLIGAGGAVRGVLGLLMQLAPTELVVLNRTSEKAEILCQELVAATSSKSDTAIRGFGLDYQADPFDLVINGTSAAYSDSAPMIDDDLVKGAVCYDMMYGRELTPFLRWSKEQGARDVSDGLGMLVGQAAESFFIWRSVRPSVTPVVDSLRRLLQ